MEMEANGGGDGLEHELGMVVLPTGWVAWVPAQAVAGGMAAIAAAMAQNGWIPAEAAARTGWVPRPDLLVMGGEEARALAQQHGWISPGARLHRIPAAARRNVPDNMEAYYASMGNPALYLALLCLPAQEIARCRSVCWAWRAIIGSGAFRRHHHDHHFRTPMPLLFFLDPSLAGLNLSAVDARDRVPRPVLRFHRPLNNEVLRVHGSCDGILLLSSGRRLYVCNPCTRRWARLPHLHVDHDIVGFYVITGPGGDSECNVLYHTRRMLPNCQYWIVTLGRDGWTCDTIGRPGPDLPSDELDLVLAKGIVPSYKIPPVFILGSLYWPPKAAQVQSNTDLLVFDTAAETFSLFTPPSIQVGGEAVPVVARQLFEIDGRLAMTAISFYPPTVDVWVESHSTTELWSHRYSIRVPVDEISLNDSCHHNGSVFALAQDRHDLVQCPRVLLHCDAQGAVLQSYRPTPQLPHHWTALSGHTIQESLLQHHRMLRMRDADAVDGDPPFF
nr:uncharacterized protein LOC127301305 [Lolium perenne]